MFFVGLAVTNKSTLLAEGLNPW